MTALVRSAGLTPATLDREGRTVEVVALSGFAPVVRRTVPAPDGAKGPWIEELDARGADLSALDGAPLLKDHRTTVDSTIGAVLSPRMEDGVDGPRIVGTATFSRKPAADEVFTDVAAGLLRGVSLGYVVDGGGWKRVGTRNGLPVWRAVRWRPRELSFTPMPADAGATVRGEDMTTTTTAAPAEMAQTTTQPPAPTPAPAPAPAAPTMTRAETNAAIRSIAATAGLDQAWIDGQIDASTTVEAARAAAFDAMQKRTAPMLRSEAPYVQVQGSHDDPNAIRSAMAHALAARLAPALVKVDAAKDRASQFIHHRALDMAGELAFIRGDRFNRFDQDALLQRAIGGHSTGDFPKLLEDAGNKILLAQYSMATPTYRRWAARRGFNDFNAHRFLRVGDFPKFGKLSESGEVKYGAMSEAREKVTPDEYATGFIINRKALINDNLGALADFSTMIGVRAAADENRMVYSVIAGDGPAMEDGKALFHADHGNKAASGGAITVETIGAARAAMRKQTSLDGIPLNIAGVLLVVGPDRELQARQVVASITAAKSADVNPWAGAFEIEVDSNIAGNRWYLFANPGMYPVVVYGYVAGAEGPQILTERDFDTQAVKVRAGLDFGCGAIDFRGAYLNTGN